MVFIWMTFTFSTLIFQHIFTLTRSVFWYLGALKKTLVCEWLTCECEKWLLLNDLDNYLTAVSTERPHRLPDEQMDRWTFCREQKAGEESERAHSWSRSSEREQQRNRYLKCCQHIKKSVCLRYRMPVNFSAADRASHFQLGWEGKGWEANSCGEGKKKN